jgi:hypothetical protein
MTEHRTIVDAKTFDEIAAAAEETGERPLDAIDGVLDLVNFFHSPHGRGIARAHVDYYAHRNLTVEGGNLPLSVDPLFAHEAEGQLLARGWLALFDDVVGEGTVYVTPRMVKIIADLAAELPDDPTLRPEDVPLEVGTVWLGAPLTLGGSIDASEYFEGLATHNRVPVRVIAWTTRERVSSQSRKVEGEVVGEKGVTIVSFTRGAEIAEVNRRTKSFTEPDSKGRNAVQLIEDEGIRWVPWETMGWGYDAPWRSATPEETEELDAHPHSWTREDKLAGIPEPVVLEGEAVKNIEQTVLRRFLFVLWRLMTEEVAVEVPFRPERHAQRRVERSKRPDLAVRVIHLRRLYDAALALTDEEKAERKRLDRQYSHRWRVRDHWRWQAYGPGMSLRKRIRVESYVKGPEGKPLVEKPRLYSVER